MSLGWSELR